MPAQLEHANFTVSDPAATADWMREVFGWHLRWEGDAMAGGHTKHVGTEAHYVALYNPGNAGTLMNTSYETIGALNHIAVVVDDLDATEKPCWRRVSPPETTPTMSPDGGFISTMRTGSNMRSCNTIDGSQPPTQRPLGSCNWRAVWVRYLPS